MAEKSFMDAHRLPPERALEVLYRSVSPTHSVLYQELSETIKKQFKLELMPHEVFGLRQAIVNKNPELRKAFAEALHNHFSQDGSRLLESVFSEVKTHDYDSEVKQIASEKLGQLTPPSPPKNFLARGFASLVNFFLVPTVDSVMERWPTERKTELIDLLRQPIHEGEDVLWRGEKPGTAEVKILKIPPRTPPKKPPNKGPGGKLSA